MLTTRAALTQSDIRTLVKGATPDERAMAAHRICQIIDRRTLPVDFPTVPGFPEGNYLKYAVAMRS